MKERTRCAAKIERPAGKKTRVHPINKCEECQHRSQEPPPTEAASALTGP